MDSTIQSWKKTFFTIFAGQAFSLLGSAVVQFSIIWWLTAKTESAVVLTIASLMGFLPQALLGPVAGTLVDRYDRKRVMIFADLMIAVSSAVLAVWVLLAEPPLWAFYVVLAVRSLGSAFHMPAWQASLPLIAPEDQLMRVAGWNQSLFSATVIAGPVLGAFLMAEYSMVQVLLLDVIGALIASGVLLFVSIPRPERSLAETAGQGMWKEMKYGLRELAKSNGLLVLTAVIGLTTLVYVPVGALFNLIVLEHFGGGAWHAGIVELAFGIGMLLGSVLLGTWGAARKQVHLIAMGIAVLGVGLVAAGLLPQSGYFAFVACSAVMGLSGPLFGGPFHVMLQTKIDPAALGRVLSIVNSMMLLATPLGLFVAGPFAEWLGVPMWFLISGTLILLISASTLLAPAVRQIEEAQKQEIA